LELPLNVQLLLVLGEALEGSGLRGVELINCVLCVVFHFLALLGFHLLGALFAVVVTDQIYCLFYCYLTIKRVRCFCTLAVSLGCAWVLLELLFEAICSREADVVSSLIAQLTEDSFWGMRPAALLGIRSGLIRMEPEAILGMVRVESSSVSARVHLLHHHLCEVLLGATIRPEGD
jgi:hypothetical protein